MKDAIAIIPARGGSRRIPGKNKRLFHSRPIIEYSIELAKVTGLFKDIIVTTDDHDLAAIAIAAGVSAHRRSPERARDEVGTQEVALEVIVSRLKEGELDLTDFACVIYPTAPLIDPLDLVAGYQALKMRWHSMAYAFAVGTEPLADAGQFYWGQVERFANLHPLIHPQSMMIPIAVDRVCDINVEEDWKRAEEMYARLKARGERLAA